MSRINFVNRALLAAARRSAAAQVPSASLTPLFQSTSCSSRRRPASTPAPPTTSNVRTRQTDESEPRRSPPPSAVNGFTLGLVGMILFMMACYEFGVRVVAPRTLAGMSDEERSLRIGRFGSTVLGRALLLLYVVYPGVSVSIFGIFSCTTLSGGEGTTSKSYLNGDFHIQCYDRTHWQYMGAGIVWLFVIPVGVPYFFIWLLRRFRVPELAKLREDCAWLQEAAQLAWTQGLQQEGVIQDKLNVDTISDNHLEALYALFCHKVDVEHAAGIFAGTTPPVLDDLPDPKKKGGEEKKEGHKHKEGSVKGGHHGGGGGGHAEGSVKGGHAEGSVKGGHAGSEPSSPKSPHHHHHKEEEEEERFGCLTEKADALKAKAHAVSVSCTAMFASKPKIVVVSARRAKILAELLTWCATCGELALPVLEWEEEDEEEEAKLEHILYEEEKELEHEQEEAKHADEEARHHAEEEEAAEEAAAEKKHVKLEKRGSFFMSASLRSSSKWALGIGSAVREERAREEAKRRAPIPVEDLPKLQRKALNEVGFLFAAYHTKCVSHPMRCPARRGPAR